MATRKTNEAVELRRKQIKHEKLAEFLDADIQNILGGLDHEEMAHFIRMTDAMEERVEETMDDARMNHWARSTTRQALSRALNSSASKDTTGVR